MATSLILTTLGVFAVTYILTKLVQLFVHIRHLATWFRNVPGPGPRHWFHGHLHLVSIYLPKSTVGEDSIFTWSRIKVPSLLLFVDRASESYDCRESPVNSKGCHENIGAQASGFQRYVPIRSALAGEGLLIAGGERWARSRRLLTPAFHFDILRPYVRVYNEAAERLISNLDEHCENGESFEVFSHVSKCTLDIILRCAFSYETDCQKPGSVHPYLKAVSELANIWWLREKRPLQYFDTIFYLTENGRKFKEYCNYVHGVAENIIHKRKASLEGSGTSQRKYLDFLDILLTATDEHGQGLTPLEIRNEVDTFLFEGHDTTASAISWTLYALANSPECKHKAQAEVDSIFDGKENEAIEWGDLNKLEYLTQCLKETLRHHSPVPFIQREITRDFEIEGRTFPRGTPVTVHIYGLHHNADVWEEPDSFIPERFAKENASKMDSYQFVPFSAGPRNCIGQNFALNEEKAVVARLLRRNCIGQNFALNEEKAVVARLLRRYNFTLDPDHVVQKKIAAIMKTETGIKMYVSRRKTEC